MTARPHLDRTHRSLVQWGALAVGATFILVGLLGFVPGVTSEYDSLEFAGHSSGAMLLGLFKISILHNIVHLLFGVAGVLMAKAAGSARSYLIGGGVIYLLLVVYGMVIDHNSDLNFVPLNIADNWLHLVLGLGMIALGVLLPRMGARTTTTTTTGRV